MGRARLTTAGFSERAKALHAGKYLYTGTQFVSSHVKVVIGCPQHGEFQMTPANHLNGQGCPKCKNARISASQRGTTADFVLKATAVHGGRYDYSSVEYSRAYGKVAIICPTHGKFMQAPATHLEGSGCPSCVGRPSVDTAEFIRRANLKHDNKYDYTHTHYVNAKTVVHVVCPIHGEFSQMAETHLHSGCNQCGNAQAGRKRRFSTAQFIDMATAVHGGKYTYEEVDYVKASQKVLITCPKHGVFKQKPNHHFAGFGCPKCRGIISKPEQEIADWLRRLGVVVEQSRRDIVPPKELDLYLPEHNIAIEYCGLYWHSHSDAAEEARDKNKHWDKYIACASKGIRLITLYDSEWAGRKATIKRLLRAATGTLRGKLMARKCAVRMVPAPEARLFFDKYHPQGGAGSGENYGLYWGDKLVACMRFALGINDRGVAGKSKVWTLSRYTTRLTVSGGAGRLLRAFQEVHSYPEVKSFSDNRLFTGGMYEALGFVLVENSPPDYAVWSQRLGLRPKAAYQRREISKRLQDYGSTETFNPTTDPRTEQDMTYLMGAARVYDCGKKKWVLDASPGRT